HPAWARACKRGAWGRRRGVRPTALRRIRGGVVMPPIVRSCFRREAEDDIEVGGKLAGLRLGDRGEVDNHGLLRLGIANAAEDAVALVLGMALDVTLGRELLLALHLDGEVDVRRAAGVGDGL